MVTFLDEKTVFYSHRINDLSLEAFATAKTFREAGGDLKTLLDDAHESKLYFSLRKFVSCEYGAKTDGKTSIPTIEILLDGRHITCGSKEDRTSLDMELLIGIGGAFTHYLEQKVPPRKFQFTCSREDSRVFISVEASVLESRTAAENMADKMTRLLNEDFGIEKKFNHRGWSNSQSLGR